MTKVGVFVYDDFLKNRDDYNLIDHHIESVESASLEDSMIIFDDVMNLPMLYDIDKLNDAIGTTEIKKLNEKGINHDWFTKIIEPEGGWYVNGEILWIKSGHTLDVVGKMDLYKNFFKGNPIDSWNVRKQKKIENGIIFYYTARMLMLDAISYITREYGNEIKTISVKQKTTA